MSKMNVSNTKSLGKEPQLSVLRVNCAQTPLDSQGISFPAAGLSWRPAWGRFAAFSLGQPSPRPRPRGELTPSGRAHPAGVQHHGGHVLRRGLAPQLGAGWSRDRATWSGADKGPLGSRTRNPLELLPSWDSWERGSNLHRQPVPISRSDAASLPNELHQVGSLQASAPEHRGAGGCGEVGLRFPSVRSANADPTGGHVESLLSGIEQGQAWEVWRFARCLGGADFGNPHLKPETVSRRVGSSSDSLMDSDCHLSVPHKDPKDS